MKTTLLLITPTLRRTFFLQGRLSMCAIKQTPQQRYTPMHIKKNVAPWRTKTKQAGTYPNLPATFTHLLNIIG